MSEVFFIYLNINFDNIYKQTAMFTKNNAGTY